LTTVNAGRVFVRYGCGSAVARGLLMFRCNPFSTARVIMATKAVERVLTDHEEIKKWAEARGAKPACAKGTEADDGTCLLRLDFPGYSGAESLQHIPWEQWFRVFDKRGLALIVEDRSADGKPSNFNKLVSRETVEQKG
jgi:hypothetical protein